MLDLRQQVHVKLALKVTTLSYTDDSGRELKRRASEIL
jgi:hypothetical protein